MVTLKYKYAIAGALVGLGLGVAFLPIGIASIMVKHNLFIEIIDRINGFWESIESDK